MLVLSKKVNFYSKAIKYPRYKLVFLDKNPTVRFSDMKNSKKPHQFKNVLKKKFQSDLVQKLMILFIS